MNRHFRHFRPAGAYPAGRERPEYLFLAAAKVGGIIANDTCPAAFIRDNLAVQLNVIRATARSPMKEEYLLSGPLEPTNRAYALAKICGVEMCWSYNRQHGARLRERGFFEPCLSGTPAIDQDDRSGLAKWPPPN